MSVAFTVVLPYIYVSKKNIILNIFNCSQFLSYKSSLFCDCAYKKKKLEKKCEKEVLMSDLRVGFAL